MSKKSGMDAVGAARSLHGESWKKLGKVIARKKITGASYEDANRLRARAAQRISFYNRLLLELNAASTIVGAPSVSEIRAIKQATAAIKAMAVVDAARESGFNAIKTAMNKSRDAAKNVKPG